MSFWDGKTPCWETKGCMGKPGKGTDCVAYQRTKFAYWNAKGTLCKGPNGNDIRECKVCPVYLKYGEGKPILLFDVTKL